LVVKWYELANKIEKLLDYRQQGQTDQSTKLGGKCQVAISEQIAQSLVIP